MKRNDLREAFLEAAEREWAAMPSQEALEVLYPPSPGFEAQMEQLIRRTNRRYVQVGRQVFRRAAVAVVALLLLLCGCMAVPAVREMVLETWHGFTSYWFPMDEEHPGPYGMGSMSMDFPEGYRLKAGGQGIRIYQMTLETDAGEEMELVRVTRGMTLLLGDEDAKDAVTEECTIGGYRCIRHSAGGVNTIVWTVGEYAYRIRGSCAMEVLERFVELYEPEP